MYRTNYGANAYDGDFSTVYHSILKNQASEEPWIKFTLSDTFRIHTVKITQSTTCNNNDCRTRLENTRVEVYSTETLVRVGVRELWITDYSSGYKYS